MKDKVQIQENNFLYNKENTKDSLLKKSTIVEPKMLPTSFREKTHFLQKIYLFFIMIFLALPIGITSFVLLDNFFIKYHIESSIQILFFVIVLVFWFLIIIASSFFVWWSRTKSTLITLTSTIGYIIPPLILSVVMIYLDVKSVDDSPDNIKNLFFILGIFSLISGVFVGLYVFTMNTIFSKSFREAKFRTFWTLPGLIIISSSIFLIWLMMHNENFANFDIVSFSASLASLFAGTILITLGVIFSIKYKINTLTTASSNIRLSTSLSSIIIFMVLLVIGLRFIKIFDFNLPFIIVLFVDLLLLSFFTIFLFLKAKIKNMAITNPLLNEFMVRGIIIVIIVVSLIIISVAPSISNLKSFAPMSFSILTISSLTLFFIATLSHFMTLIVFEKFIKMVIIGIVFSVLIVLGIVFVFGTLKNTDIIMQVVSRRIVQILFIIVAIFEVIILSMNSITIYKESIQFKKIKSIKEG